MKKFQPSSLKTDWVMANCPSVSHWVSDEPKYRAAFTAKKKIGTKNKIRTLRYQQDQEYGQGISVTIFSWAWFSDCCRKLQKLLVNFIGVVVVSEETPAVGRSRSTHNSGAFYFQMFPSITRELFTKPCSAVTRRSQFVIPGNSPQNYVAT